MEPKIKMIKKDAVVKVDIGTGFIQKIQQLLIHVTNGLTQEDINEYKKLLEEKAEFTKDWMEPLTTISILIKEIEQQAEKQGFTYDVDTVEEAVKEVEG